MAKLNSTTLKITLSEMLKDSDSARELITAELLETINDVLTTVLGNNVLVELSIDNKK